jgi:hypothetical protein
MQRLICLTILSLVLIPDGCFGQVGPNFSGSYQLTSRRGVTKKKKALPLEILKVHHEGLMLDVIITREGKEEQRHFTLDGSESKTIHPQGGVTTEKARIKKTALEIESIFHLSGNPVSFRMKEKWQLSRDAKTLTIRSQEDMLIRAGAPATTDELDTGSSVEVYARLE